MDMDWYSQTRICVGDHPTTSLCWRGDDLVDWVHGGDAWTADGRFVSACRGWGYDRLDAAVADASGRWALVHERTGTAGILLRDGQIVREIHRSPYHADAFLFSACLFGGPGGRVLLAHCPDAYARIELDDAESGERLTRCESREEVDFFHSRLAVSPGARRLLSAGWVWHPWDAVVWFDIEAALEDPTRLDRLQGAACSRNVCLAEEASATWLDDDRVIIGGSDEPEDAEEASETDREQPGPRLRPNGLALYDLGSQQYLQAIAVGYPPGTMMAAGSHHVVTFFERPRLVSLRSGRVVHEWEEIASGDLVSSIVHSRPCPVLALDPARARFAVGAQGAIEVVALDLARLPD